MNRRRALPSIFFAAISFAALTGCTYVNVPMNPSDVPMEQRVRNHTRATTGAAMIDVDARDSAPIMSTATSRPARTITDNDGCFVGLALSGGGSRSANFSAASMFELQRLGLLQRVDYISSVSGGSLAGAYYCLNDQSRWNPGNVQGKFTHSFATDVILSGFLPWNTFALWFTDFDRSDLLAASFKRTLFTSRTGGGQTYADLRADRPRLLINSTDLQSGRPFVFCDESFDQLNTDLAKYPIAYAVAASAAVPVAMHHVTLRDFATKFEQFRHLIDGGINDNLGITSLVETYEAHENAAIKSGAKDPYPHGAVLFVIDARTRFDVRLDNKGDIGLLDTLATGATMTTTALLNRVSNATLAEFIVRYSPNDVTAEKLREQIAELDREGYITVKDRRGHDVTVVHLALSRVADLTNLPSQGFFQRLNEIATYLNIPEDAAASLYKAAQLLVAEKYEERLRALEATLNRDVKGK